MNELLDRIDAEILALRFNGMSLDDVADLTETDRKVVRIREAKAMATLRRAGHTDQEIRAHFEPERTPIWA